jgi:hypothetical protein
MWTELKILVLHVLSSLIYGNEDTALYLRLYRPFNNQFPISMEEGKQRLKLVHVSVAVIFISSCALNRCSFRSSFRFCELDNMN